MGIEPLRYYLLREIVFGQDGNFSYDALVTRYNSDLANGLGNLASRTLTMIEKYCGGANSEARSRIRRAAREAAACGNDAIAAESDGYDQYQFSLALEAIWESVAVVDRSSPAEKPWTLAEDPKQRARLAAVLYTAAEGLRIVTVLAHPVIPEGDPKNMESARADRAAAPNPLTRFSWGQLKPGTESAKPEGIFPRVDKAEAIERIEAMEQEPASPRHR